MLELQLEQYYQRQKKIQLNSTIWNVLANDQNNRMPPQAQKTRSDQLNHINSAMKSLSSDREYTNLVQFLYSQLSFLSPKDARSVQLAQRGINFSQKYTHDFNQRFAKAKSDSLEARKIAKKNNDRLYFVPYLKKSIELAKEYAKIYDSFADPYDIWLDGWHTWMKTEAYEEIFKPILETSKQILSKTKKTPFHHHLTIDEYDINKLYDLIIELIQDIWYDLTQGTFNIIKRPYSENCWPWDERIHIGKDKPLLESILAALHECGHWLMDMHINPEYHWTNLHRTSPMGIHESQSRTLENFIGRSKPFCVYLDTLLDKHFPEYWPWDPDEIYEYLNHVSPEVVRTNADELTYNIHIYIRFTLEQEIFDWSTPLENVPNRRNELYQEHLWIIPESDVNWCLQDQHWALWLFGYFPAYTIGNMVAAQLRESYRFSHPHRGEAIIEGDFSEYFSWYQNAIRRHGNMYHPNSLIKNITWSEINPDALVQYLNEKYLLIPWNPNPEWEMSQERALNDQLIKHRKEIKTQRLNTVGEYKNTFDELYKDTQWNMSYIPNEIQMDSQETISTVSQQENMWNQRLQ